MKTTREVLGDVACSILLANVDDFGSSVMVDEQTFQEIEFAVALKRALHSGAKRIVIDIVGDKKK